MKYCEEFAALLDPFVDGELSPEEAARVRAHLKVCGGCRSYVDAALTMRDAFPDIEDTDVPVDFAGRVMAAIQAEAVSQTEAVSQAEAAPKKRPVPWRKVLLPMAACLAIVVAAGQLPRMDGGFAADTAESAAATAQSPAIAGENGENTPILFSQTAEEKAESSENELAEDAAQTTGEKRSMTVFSTQDGAYSQEAAVSDTERQSDKAASPEAPSVFAASARAYGRQARVSLTEEQRERLLADYEAETLGDGTVRYTLTAEQFDAITAALEDEGVQPDIQQDEETGPDLCYLLVTVE